MAVRDDFSAGEVLAAADLNDTFAEKLPYSYGTATPSTSDSGFLWYDSNSTPPDVKFWDGSAFQALGGGTILQIVRATDTSRRTTTSTSFVDASISVTITPQKSTSAVILIHSCIYRCQNNTDTDVRMELQITDSSNNEISGGEGRIVGLNNFTYSGTGDIQLPHLLIAYATPATTSATTYKVRYAATANVIASLMNDLRTGQLYAIEVAA